MNRLFFLLVVIVLGTATTFGQDWVSSSAGDRLYNCDVVKSLDHNFGDQVYVRFNDTEYTVEEFHALTVPDCSTEPVAIAVTSEETFKITVDNAVNLRECAGTSCSRVGRALSGDFFEVVGEDGEWFEIEYENTTAFIAGWLTKRVVDAAEGLLADFQFSAVSPAGEEWALLYGSTSRTGTHWLNLTRADGSKTDIQVEALFWGTGDSSDGPRFFGWGGNDWELLPELIPNSSFYVYLPNVDELYELPVSSSLYVDSYNLVFDMLSRPSSIRRGTPIRVTVADSGQTDAIKAWVTSGVQPQVVQSPARPEAPTLVAGDGQISILLPQTAPVSGGEPISTYEMRYGESGNSDSQKQVGNVSGEAYVVDNLTNGKGYQFAIAAISRGGKGPYSNFASSTPSN